MTVMLVVFSVMARKHCSFSDIRWRGISTLLNSVAASMSPMVIASESRMEARLLSMALR
jgi:hypothetical protein